MSQQNQWPRQKGTHYFNMAELEVIASAITAEVFWTFEAVRPHSVADVAALLERPASTIRYHVSQLVDAGLLLAVETRRRRSRVEEAYVHASTDFRAEEPPHSPEYTELMMRGFSSILKQLHRERASLLDLVNEDLSNRSFGLLSWGLVRLTKSGAKEFQRRLSEMLDELEAMSSDDPDALRVKLFVQLAPSMQAAKVLQRRRDAESPAD